MWDYTITLRFQNRYLWSLILKFSQVFPHFQRLVILALSAGSEGVGRIWEVRCQYPKILDGLTWFSFDMIYYYYYYCYYIHLNFLLYFENKEIFFSLFLCMITDLLYIFKFNLSWFCWVLSLVLDEFKQILIPFSISIAWSVWIHVMLGVNVGHNLLSYFFSFIFTFIKCKLIIRNIFLLSLLTIRKSERASNQGIYNQGVKVLVTTKDIKKGDRA